MIFIDFYYHDTENNLKKNRGHISLHANRICAIRQNNKKINKIVTLHVYIYPT
jgi:hypothetical protein